MASLSVGHKYSKDEPLVNSFLYCRSSIFTNLLQLFLTFLFMSHSPILFFLFSRPDSMEEASALANNVGILAKRMLGI